MIVVDIFALSTKGQPDFEVMLRVAIGKKVGFVGFSRIL